MNFAHDILPSMDDFDGLRGPFTEVPASAFARVWKCRLSIAGKYLDLYLKHYLNRSFIDFAKHLLRPSRALRAFDASLLLAENGFGCPTVIAVGTIARSLHRRKHFMLTTALHDTRPLHQWLSTNLPPHDHRSLSSRRQLIRTLAHTIGSMHARGIFHGDLRPGNIHALQTPDAWRFFFLDNERTARRITVIRRRTVKNLTQIGMLGDDHITATDRIRFLNGYLEANPRLAPDRKPLARRVAAATSRRMAHKSPPDNA